MSEFNLINELLFESHESQTLINKLHKQGYELQVADEDIIDEMTKSELADLEVKMAELKKLVDKFNKIEDAATEDAMINAADDLSKKYNLYLSIDGMELATRPRPEPERHSREDHWEASSYCYPEDDY